MVELTRLVESLRRQRLHREARISPPEFVRLSPAQQQRILDKPVSWLEQFVPAEDKGFVRLSNTLEEIKVYTIRDLLNCNQNELLGVANLGETMLKQLLALLEKCGFYPASRRAELNRQMWEYTRLRSRLPM